MTICTHSLSTVKRLW